jgi:hypothetical protein
MAMGGYRQIPEGTVIQNEPHSSACAGFTHNAVTAFLKTAQTFGWVAARIRAAENRISDRIRFFRERAKGPTPQKTRYG